MTSSTPRTKQHFGADGCFALGVVLVLGGFVFAALDGSAAGLVLVVPGAVLGIGSIGARLDFTREPDPNYCKSCGYSREGLTAAQCPECGEAFSEACVVDAVPAPPQSLSGSQTARCLGCAAFAVLCPVLGFTVVPLEKVYRALHINTMWEWRMALLVGLVCLPPLLAWWRVSAITAEPSDDMDSLAPECGDTTGREPR